MVTSPHGYGLEIDPDQVDAHRFERLLEEGRSELAAHRPAQALDVLEQALALWSGPVLADLSYEAFAQAEIARLEDLRVAAVEQLIEAKLALGRHAEVVGQLETLIAGAPVPRAAARAADARAVPLRPAGRRPPGLPGRAGSKLVEELGIEPGERLRELEGAILAQDAALAVPRHRRLRPRWRRHRGRGCGGTRRPSSCPPAS